MRGETTIPLIEKPVILKLGGSAITIKEKTFTPNKKAIARLGAEIKRANVGPLILVHGGGSFGHPLAEKYRLTDGFCDSSQLIGFVKTHEAMVSLNGLLVNSLIDRGVPAFGMPPSSFMLMKHGRVQVLESRSLKRAIEIGLTPVLYGDVAFDLHKGFDILSGDKIAALLAVELGAERIIMAVDVDGIYTDDPKVESAARLIRRLTLDDLRNLHVKIGKPKVSDVTGGMLGKVLELAVPIEQGVEAVIVNGLRPNDVYRALKGEECVGTRITKT